MIMMKDTDDKISKAGIDINITILIYTILYMTYIDSTY